jgi:hypothetical protein
LGIRREGARERERRDRIHVVPIISGRLAFSPLETHQFESLSKQFTKIYFLVELSFRIIESSY